jgi:hypothetical protein
MSQSNIFSKAPGRVVALALDVQQGSFGAQPFGMSDEVRQHGKGFGRQGNALRTAPEARIVWVQTKAAKEPLGEASHALLSS